MSRPVVQNAAHACQPRRAASGVGISPGHDESAGKRRSGHICQGNRGAKTVLIKQGMPLVTPKRIWENNIVALVHGGDQEGPVAVGHSILVIFYHMVKTGEFLPGERS